MIYLDNAATTRASKRAADAAYEIMTENYANPSSLHFGGILAEREMEKARGTLSKIMNVDKEELFFTSGGTMSDNLAIKGYLSTKRNGRVITTAFEHPAVLECFKQLEQTFEVVYLKPENGMITTKLLMDALTPDTVFVSIMQVNNETGAISPLKELAKVIKESGIDAVFHTDAVQGFLKEPFNYHIVDMASFSGHKTHGPKGVGGLYIKKGIKIKPITSGGGQEKGVFSGTSNTPAIVGWKAAAEELDENISSIINNVTCLKNLAEDKLSALGGIVLSPRNASPFILNIAFPGYVAENILHYLSNHEIYVSTGSACSSKKGSHVLKAVGQEKLQKSSIRLSFSNYNNQEEILFLCNVMEKALKDIIKN